MKKQCIRNATLLTMDADSRVLPGASVCIEGSDIAWVGQTGEEPSDYAECASINARGRVVMPGFVNAHTHLAMTLLRGRGNDRKLQEWLQNVIWPAEERLQTGDCYWGSMLAMAEMARTGTTAFLDMYFNMAETAQALLQTGMRAVLSRGVTGSVSDPERSMREAEELFTDYNGACDGRIHVMMAPHAEYTNTPQILQRIANQAARLGCGLHLHASETRREVQDCILRHGVSPVVLFDRLGLLKLPTVAAHCVHVDAQDIAILTERGVSVAHNPGSNSKLASGIAPVAQMLSAGVNVALGTDGAASNNNLDMLEETFLAAMLSKIYTDDATSVSAMQALRMATINGAKALGIDARTGSIETGKAADIIMFDDASPAWHPRCEPDLQVVYAASGADVCLTMVDGRILLRDGVLQDFDMPGIAAHADEISARLFTQ